MNKVSVVEVVANNLPDLQKLIEQALIQKEELDATLERVGKFKLEVSFKNKFSVAGEQSEGTLPPWRKTTQLATKCCEIISSGTNPRYYEEVLTEMHRLLRV